MKCIECGSTQHQNCGLINHGGGGAMLPTSTPEPQVFLLEEIPHEILGELATAKMDPDHDALDNLLYQG